MFDAFIEGLFLVLQWKAFSLMLVGMGLGFCVGLLPGIGGAATLALMIPFVFTMQPAEAFAFLLGMHAVAATTGDITSVHNSLRRTHRNPFRARGVPPSHLAAAARGRGEGHVAR